MPEKSEKSVADKDWIQTQHMLLGALKDLEAQLKGAAATENKKSEKGKKGKDTGGSFADRMVGKLSADPTKGVFESLKESISETLDPVNIIKSMTGGSKLAGVLTERVMGRNLSTPDQAQTPPNNTTANAPSQDGMSLGDGGNVSENIQLTLSDISVRVDSIATAMGVSAEKQEVALEVQNEQLRLQFENTEVNKKIEKHGEKAEQQYEESKALLEQSADEARETALETAKGGKGGGAGKPGLEGLVPGAGVPGAGGEKEEKGGGILGFISTASGVFKMAGTGLASIAASAEGILPTIGAVAAGALAVTGIAAAADWLMDEKADADKTGDEANEATGNIQEEQKGGRETYTKVAGEKVDPTKPLSDDQMRAVNTSKMMGNKLSTDVSAAYDLRKAQDAGKEQAKPQAKPYEKQNTSQLKYAPDDSKTSATAPTAKATTPTAAPTEKATTPTAAPTEKDTTPTAAPTEKSGGGKLKNPYSDSDNRFTPEFQQRVAQLMESDDYSIFSEKKERLEGAEIEAKAEYKATGTSPYRKENIEAVKKTSGDMAKSLSENPTPGGESRPPTAAPGAVAGAPPTAVKQEELKAPSALSAPRPSSEGRRGETYTKVAGEKVDPTKPLSDKQMAAVNMSKMMGNPQSPDIQAAYDLRKAQDAGVPASATPPPESGIKLDNTSKENKVAQSAPGSVKGSAGSTTNTNVVTNTAPQTIMQPGMPGPRTSESSFMRAQDRLQARW